MRKVRALGKSINRPSINQSINQSINNQSRIVEPGMMILTVLSQYRYFLNAGTQFVCEKEGL